MESGINQYSSPTEKFPQGSIGEAREKVAELFKINPHYISDAKRIQQVSGLSKKG